MRAQLALVSACLFLSSVTAAQQPSTTIPGPVAPQKTEASQVAAKTPPANPPATHTLDSADLGAFFDGIIPLQLERADIAGASVLVMQNDKLLLQRGYGYANAKEKTPVDPANTIFRLASISKLFTWISVMQLQEQGKLDLDTDINTYLDFKIRPAFDKPITIRNLMTHTGGFEEETRDIIIIHPKKSPTLRDFLIANQPKRLFPPGLVPGYSNYGVGLGSYIVERLSGQSFERYVADHIFGPLGMTHSTFYQPPQKDLELFPSEGYRSSSLKPPVGFEIFNPVGAGGVSSTAADMGRFGRALLNGGELDGKRILKPETLAAMYAPQFRADAQLPPLGMGFYQTWRNNLRWIGHEGDLIAFHSLFFIEPTQHLILFISCNSASSAGRVRPELVDMFSDRYFPFDGKQKFADLPRGQLKSFEGTYQSTRRADSTKLRMGNLFSQRSAHLDKDGILQLPDAKDLRGHVIKWKPLNSNLLQEVEGQHRIFAIRNRDGKVIRLAYDFPGVQAERVRWFENSQFVFTLLGLSMFAMFAVISAALSRTIRRRVLRRRPPPEPQPATRWLPLTTQIAAWLWCFIVATILIVFVVIGDDIAPPTKSWDKYFYLTNAVTLLAIFFSALAVVSAAFTAMRADLRSITKIKFSLVAGACLFLSWFAIHWNILGPATRF
jgi:CubicO group peptidase (beta-lactamase class C family)